MSSSTISEYEVRENLERERLGLEVALREIKNLDPRYAALLRQAAELRKKYPGAYLTLPKTPLQQEPKSLSTRKEAEAYRDALYQAAAHIESSLLSAMCREESQQYVQRVTMMLGTRAAKEVLRTTDQRNKSTSKVDRQRIVRDFSEVFAQLQIPEAALRELQRCADELLGVSDVRLLETGLADFRARAAEAQKQESARARERAEVACLRRQLTGLDEKNVHVRNALGELDRIERGEAQTTDALRSLIAKLHREWVQESDRLYVAHTISQKLRDLHYDVGEGFETLFVDGGHIHIQKPEWVAEPTTQHVVEWEVDRTTGQVGAKVMRVGDPAQEIQYGDAEGFDTTLIERAWCADLLEVLKTLQSSGVDVRVDPDSFIAAGEGKDVPILPTALKTPRARQGRGQALRSRKA